MPEQVWPALANPPHTHPEIALARSASEQTIWGSLPPSSSTEPLRCLAQISPTARPTSTEPVKKIFRAEDSQSAAPIAPPPWTTRTSPSGRPPFSKVSRIRSPRSGVRLAGFRTTPFPAINAIATSSNGIDQG